MLASAFGAHRISATSHADADTATATVLRTVDGDTVDVIDDSRGRLRIRVLGVDTPEATTKVGCWGPQATEFATSTLLGARVAVVTDPTQDLHDRYGRLGLRREGWWLELLDRSRPKRQRARLRLR